MVLTSRSEQPPQCRWKPLGRTLIPKWVAFRSSDRQPRKGSVRRSPTVESLLGVLYRFGQIVGSLPNMKVTPSRRVYYSHLRIARKGKTGEPRGMSVLRHGKTANPGHGSESRLEPMMPCNLCFRQSLRRGPRRRTRRKRRSYARIFAQSQSRWTRFAEEGISGLSSARINRLVP